VKKVYIFAFVCPYIRTTAHLFNWKILATQTKTLRASSGREIGVVISFIRKSRPLKRLNLWRCRNVDRKLGNSSLCTCRSDTMDTRSFTEAN